jgi:hypothetical protein
MEEAERIAREEHGSGRIAVISGKLSAALALDELTTRCRNKRLLQAIGILVGWTLYGQGPAV